ncbi:hypothetical protein NN561_015327 [Cricetulus griseus]
MEAGPGGAPVRIHLAWDVCTQPAARACPPGPRVRFQTLPQDPPGGVLTAAAGGLWAVYLIASSPDRSRPDSVQIHKVKRESSPQTPTPRCAFKVSAKVAFAVLCQH